MPVAQDRTRSALASRIQRTLTTAKAFTRGEQLEDMRGRANSSRTLQELIAPSDFENDAGPGVECNESVEVKECGVANCAQPHFAYRRK